MCSFGGHVSAPTTVVFAATLAGVAFAQTLESAGVGYETTFAFEVTPDPSL